jgi:hypothetical protein
MRGRRRKRRKSSIITVKGSPQSGGVDKLLFYSRAGREGFFVIAYFCINLVGEEVFLLSAVKNS